MKQSTAGCIANNLAARCSTYHEFGVDSHAKFIYSGIFAGYAGGRSQCQSC